MWNFECELISRKILLFWQIFEKKSWNTILRFNELFWPLFQFLFMANLTVIITPINFINYNAIFLEIYIKMRNFYYLYLFKKMKWTEKSRKNILQGVPYAEYTRRKKCNRRFVIWEKKLQKDLNNNSPHLGYRLHSK